MTEKFTHHVAQISTYPEKKKRVVQILSELEFSTVRTIRVVLLNPETPERFQKEEKRLLW